jgi:CRISPR/Cas system CMR-associated protein Cmr5 small subunit
LNCTFRNQRICWLCLFFHPLQQFINFTWKFLSKLRKIDHISKTNNLKRHFKKTKNWILELKEWADSLKIEQPYQYC